jgi:hypothetical protein
MRLLNIKKIIQQWSNANSIYLNCQISKDVELPWFENNYKLKLPLYNAEKIIILEYYISENKEGMLLKLSFFYIHRYDFKIKQTNNGYK